MFAMARPNSEQREQPESATIHVANIMITNDTLLNIQISADPGIEIAWQSDLVVSRNHSEGRIQRIMKANFHIIR